VNPAGLPGLLMTVAARAGEAAAPAVEAMGERYRQQLQQVTLRQYVHPPGMKTDSPPGSPPAYVTGQLANSITLGVVDTGGPIAHAYVGPHTVYAAIQEWGGHIRPVRAHYLRWVEDGAVHFSKHVYLPERPYMQPALDELIATGAFQEAAGNAFSVTVWGRT
jgi:phage gpG-like protein